MNSQEVEKINRRFILIHEVNQSLQALVEVNRGKEMDNKTEKIIDKLINLQSGANSTQKTPINWGKVQILKTTSQLINLESAPPHQNNSVCLVTKLDISMQRKGSKFLCVKGLKYYKENQPETYQKLTEIYLAEKQKGKSFDR